MSEPIAEKLENYDLQRFRNDFRRAMRMHRKGRLTLFFGLHFPMTEPILEEVSGHRVYRDREQTQGPDAPDAPSLLHGRCVHAAA